MLCKTRRDFPKAVCFGRKYVDTFTNPSVIFQNDSSLFKGARQSIIANLIIQKSREFFSVLFLYEFTNLTNNKMKKCKVVDY